LPPLLLKLLHFSLWHCYLLVLLVLLFFFLLLILLFLLSPLLRKSVILMILLLSFNFLFNNWRWLIAASKIFNLWIPSKINGGYNSSIFGDLCHLLHNWRFQLEWNIILRYILHYDGVLHKWRLINNASIASLHMVGTISFFCVTFATFDTFKFLFFCWNSTDLLSMLSLLVLVQRLSWLARLLAEGAPEWSAVLNWVFHSWLRLFDLSLKINNIIKAYWTFAYWTFAYWTFAYWTFFTFAADLCEYSWDYTEMMALAWW
jgi:hypothetical protein